MPVCSIVMMQVSQSGLHSAARRAFEFRRNAKSAIGESGLSTKAICHQEYALVTYSAAELKNRLLSVGVDESRPTTLLFHLANGIFKAAGQKDVS